MMDFKFKTQDLGFRLQNKEFPRVYSKNLLNIVYTQSLWRL